ncbi:ACP phosphodiesterase [Flagellimonas lutaonensis]|uniref:Acyl carrier protein phosphodiesterase n=1 Tax=Flagellimonas lutaonensis TaxID=516051 RepID=A0A0D5YWY7_9FLAO|nr:acyl carrier protein phosphodiesterase [Allomuricauda lutaonensis]AKA36426.1 Acyl carrier protein phosphodiesterase [Allomuricauda lutaonensis]
MNFLAHIYLSFDDPEIALGNFFADHIRGNKYGHYPEKVQKGILLHRAIDTFTDTHPIPRKSSKRLHKNYGHYSRVIVDIFYDYFLAKNWRDYSSIPLKAFVNNFYDLLEENYGLLPLATQQMLPYMIAHDWLCNYSNLKGIARVLSGMNRRTQNRSKMNLAIIELEAHYTDFEKEFSAFFEELITFSRQKFIFLCEN